MNKRQISEKKVCNLCHRKNSFILHNVGGGKFICSSCKVEIVERESKIKKENLLENPPKEKINKIYQQNKEELLKKRKEITKNYYFVLKQATKDIDDFDGILKYLPEFYKLSCNIINNQMTDWYTKTLLNCSLAYYVLEKDIIPDKSGDKGYLDNLYLCAYVLKQIRDNVSKEIILNNLEGVNIERDGEEILELIYDVLTKCLVHLNGKEEKILNLVGLSKFNSLDLLCVNDKIAQITVRKKKLKVLYSMVAVKVKSLLSYIGDTKIERIKEYVQNHPEYGEIKRYGAFLDNE